MNEEKKRVDEDWKRRVREEQDKVQEQGKSAPPEAGGGEGPGGPTAFTDFVNTLATEALIFLGAVAHPQTGQAMFAPEQAKNTIDILHMLQEKTKGNLTSDEDGLLKNVVHELRVAFLESTTRHAAPPPPPPRK